MFKRILLSTAASIIILAACNSKKKTAATVVNNDEPVIVLDTIKVLANESPANEIYKESNPRSSDILHTRLDVSFDWTKSYLNGTATIDLKQYFYPSNMLYLNARGMDIKKIEVFELANNKSNLVSGSAFKYENDSIKIDLGRVFTAKENYRVIIQYVSKPDELKEGGSNAISSDKGLYFINPTGKSQHKMPQIWTQGETQSSSAWFPTIDSPNEKMTQEIYMTVDDKYVTLSNGLLINSKKNPDGTRTDYWKMDLPHSPYLAMMAVGQFKKVVDEPWNGKEISYYVEKEYEPHAKGIFGDTKEMIEFYSNRLGVPYPWQKYAQIAVRDYVSGAMENTSATLHGDFAVYQTTREMIDGKKGEDIIAHELFHQWFGDLVTSESWSNLPLNESFATYGEYLWEEYKNGRDAADIHHAQSRSGYMMSDKEVNLIRFNYENREDMFDAFSYNKGGQVLHMLRKAIGDDAFFASLKNYLETNKFKTGEIHQLRLAFEEVTGKDMNWFFNQWFLSKGRPNIKVSKNYNSSTNEVELTVEQKQDLTNTPLYKLPIDIDIYVNGKAKRTRIWANEQKQIFKLKCDGQPQLVNFDAERQLLCDLEYIKTTEEYIFQYKNAPLYDDRIEALRKLEPKITENDIYELFKLAAQNDKFSPIRNYALNRLDKSSSEKMADVKSVLLSIYANDKKTTVRASALAALNNKFANDADVMALNEKALSEVSYAIVGEALQAITKSNPKLAMERAKQFETEFGKDIIFPLTDLYAANGSDDQIAYFQNAMKYINGFELLTFSSNYAKTAKRCKTSAAAMAAAADLEGIALASGRMTRYAGVKGVKDILGVWITKEKQATTNIEKAKKENKDVSGMEKELKEISSTKEALQNIYNKIK